MDVIATKFIMHGPCGVANPNSPCMEDGKCTKKFPKDFTEQTMECGGYPQYRQRDDGKYVMKNGVPLDNSYLVPYNPSPPSGFEQIKNMRKNATFPRKKTQFQQKKSTFLDYYLS